MHLGEILYETGVRAFLPVLRAVAPLHRRLQRAADGRIASAQSLQAWATSKRDRTRPLLWLHAPSVGEALMAQAILAEVRARAPHVQCMFTFFSPSAERIAARVGADWAGYLPWDTRRAVCAALDAVAPDCIAFVRTEIWPVLVRETQARGARTLLVNAVLAPDSTRTRGRARFLLGDAYRRLDAIGAVTAEDAARFSLFDVDAARVHITGDARFDQVAQRVQGIDRDTPLLRSLVGTPGPWLVAGSTWPEDEVHLIGAFTRLRADGVVWRAIIAPHEPTAPHIASLQQRLAAAGLSHTILPPNDAPLSSDARVVIVDRVGVLADLYAIAHIAYVGGGFGTAGLHSVVEPAALGVPVAYGPRHGNAREAERLAAAAGGMIIGGAASLYDVLETWLNNNAQYAQAAAAARAFVDAHTGGAAANAQLILTAAEALRR